MAEQIFSGLMVATAVALLVRLALGERGRARVARRWREATRRISRATARRPAPPAKPLDARAAARLAEDAIRRARDRSAVRDGNVIKPSAFRDGGEGGERDGGRRDRNLH